MSEDRPRALSWPTVFALSLLLTGLLFVWTIADGPVVDDNPLLKLTQLHRLGDLARVFIPDAGTYWRPLAKLSVVPFSSLFGMAAWPHRAVAMILNALAATLLFALGRRLFGDRAAFAATLVFLLHPLHAGALHWISARPDLLATVFVLAALVCFARRLNDEGRRQTAGVIGFAFCAYLSKEVAFVTPLLLALVAIASPAGPAAQKTRRAMPALAGSILALAAVLALRLALMSRLGGPDALRQPLPDVILGNLLLAIPRALLLPINHAVTSRTMAWPATVILLALACFAFATMIRRRKSFGAYFGLLFAFVAALPMAPFLFTGRNLEAAYMLYLPSAGFALWLGALFFPTSAVQPRSRRLGAVALTALAVVYLPLSFLHLRAHHDAAATAERITQSVVDEASARRASTWLLDVEPHQVDGVPLFYDHIDQLFWNRPAASGKTILLVGQNFWREEGGPLGWRELARSRDVAVLQWRLRPNGGGYMLTDLTQPTLAAWSARAATADTPVRVSFAPTAPPSAEATPDGIRWRKGPITCALETPDELAAALRLHFTFTLRTFDPRAAKEAAFDWTDQQGEQHRVLFSVFDDGASHTYALPLAVDPRWARTTRIRAAVLHLPFVAGELRFR